MNILKKHVEYEYGYGQHSEGIVIYHDAKSGLVKIRDDYDGGLYLGYKDNITEVIDYETQETIS